FSDTGMVATDQTFLPFGMQPDDGATFVAGCAEMAEKPVIGVGVDLAWTDLPDRPGGFAPYAAAYGKDLPVPAPELRLDYLSGDGWKSVAGGKVEMCDRDPITDRLRPEWRGGGQVQGHSEPAQGPVAPRDFASRQTIRAGLVRLTLSGTAGGFHAQRYPLALVAAMRPRRTPFGRRPMPPAPFVPRIARFALSYRASGRIDAEAPDAARPGDRIIQVGPHGAVEVYPMRMMREIGLFPKRLGYGELYIQLTGADLTGATVLAFEMEATPHLRVRPAPNPIRWFYLSPAGWAALPDTAVSSDTTDGLIRSGLVAFDLPEDAARPSPEMPAGGAWIAAAARNPDLSGFPALRQVDTGGVWVSCTDGTHRSGAAARTWTFDPPRPEIAGIREIATPAVARPPETDRAYVTRMGERLRHRARAVTPWDMERLVLEAFPEVWMAKCLPHLSRQDPRPAPGHVTLVVVRGPGEADATAVPQPRFFDIATLGRIEAFLARRASDMARIEVVNPSFERLQVRAKVELEAHRSDGAMAQQVRRDLGRALSVWTADETLARFGWSLDLQGLRARIAALPAVRGLTDLSVLHLAGDDARTYRLGDTARGPGVALRPRAPWGLPLSAPDHVLKILPGLEDRRPAPSGIGRLAVGDMLVVGGRGRP
ncbi:MAG: hypothetical protein AAF390_14025, partial [Pseudomonadota bacterium]